MHSTDYINAELASAYGLTGTLERLDGEYDLNFRLNTQRDQRYLVKVMRAGCDTGLVDLQCAALDHLTSASAHLPLPKLVPARDGKPHRLVSDDSGGDRILWVQEVLPGRNMNRVRPWTDQLLRDLGACLGRFTQAMTDFRHPYSERGSFKWDLANAGWIGDHVDVVSDPELRTVISRCHSHFQRHLAPRLGGLRQSVIHGDVNDCNVLLETSPEGHQTMTGLIDFGDMCLSPTVCDLAIACAYGSMHKEDPVGAMAIMVSAFNAEFALTEQELGLVFPLVMTRLAVSVVNASLAALDDPDDAYAQLSQSDAQQLLLRLASVPPRVAEVRLRIACGLEPVMSWPALKTWITRQAPFAEVFPDRARPERLVKLDLSYESDLGGADISRFDLQACGRAVESRTRHFADLGVGCYGEARPVYGGPNFMKDTYTPGRTHHLGVDLFAPAGTAVAAPLAGTVQTVDVMAEVLDYGGLVVLRHRAGDSTTFFTLYGHLDPGSLAALSPGQKVEAGEAFAVLGGVEVNGGWPPHLHFQLLLEILDGFSSPPGVSTYCEFEAYSALSPNPADLLNLKEAAVSWTAMPERVMKTRRKKHFADNLKLSYAQPFAPVRAWKHHLYDAQGYCYLDAYNNVPHVGHCHPRVVEAVTAQLGRLNTNSRYLYRQLGDYAERLAALLPPPLEVCFFVNSGSEANELALRLARTHTGARDMLVMDHGYHGWTTGAFAMSPYKIAHGAQRAPWAHITPQPDCYRGRFTANDTRAGEKYAEQVSGHLHKLMEGGRRVAGYICEALPSVGGQIVPPANFLKCVYASVRAAGGVCILDDVQTGFGRVGSHMWGFGLHGVTPDILVLGKPMGNGFPMGAVVTTREIATSFNNGIEYFSTFGGNTVACAAGMAVLDVLEDEGLQSRADQLGNQLKAGLFKLQSQFPIMGEVRGHGLFLGVELVADRQSKAPASRQAEYIKNRMRSKRVLLGLEGPHDNVLKIRPPLSFDEAAADRLLSVLGGVLAEVPAQPDGG